MALNVEPIYEALHHDLRRFVARRVDDPHAVDDILQDTYLRLHTHLSTLRQPERLTSWVYQVTRHAIIDHYRRGQRRPPAVELPDDLAQPDDPNEDAERDLARSLAQMVDCLPEKYREALVLTDLNGLSQQALAEQLGLSLSGAKSRVQRAREQLRKVYLDCCHVELDRLGGVVGYEERCENCN
jgi:RNA polymerase sigma-70 factor (ECF subfamily)